MTDTPAAPAGPVQPTCDVCLRVKGEVGARVDCAVCRREKQPRGRAAPMMADYCDWDCPGYNAEPQAGNLWPGETRRVFGFNLPPDEMWRCYRKNDSECLSVAHVTARLRAENAALVKEVRAFNSPVEVEGYPIASAASWRGAYNYAQKIADELRIALTSTRAALAKAEQERDEARTLAEDRGIFCDLELQTRLKAEARASTLEKQIATARTEALEEAARLFEGPETTPVVGVVIARCIRALAARAPIPEDSSDKLLSGREK